ncbi:putative intermediate filament, rod domain, coil 1B [Helianthus annuus]|nr:hypothetical protein HanHA300_Chr08g0291751 [Helianthus annuus]KAJ0548233.1 putative intermediate filament, rod domain, coil 1B [Helianthus annuus]KAJ0720191.1 hypothetical protein HanLR1_Chr08g0290501 [Helianthus annuus]KAJ0723418.1 hypothetical protein HanOQP8_Chr08g0298001 [Helianthus annuus]KAJ0954674.1 putative intermediate filament, rod domain, coil 1B [Helianthus annuus]
MFTHRIKCDGYIYRTIGERFALIIHLLSLFSLESSNFLQIFKSFIVVLQGFPRKVGDLCALIVFKHMAEEEVQVEGGPVPVLKWDQGLFEQLVRGFQFPAEWDTRYPQQGQTAADAPPGYITLFADFFLEGTFHLPATHFIATILHFYGFQISEMSPMGMVRVRHFEFLCRSHGLEPDIEKFRSMYQLIRNMGFYSFTLRNVKKILLNPSKSFHDWKMKFFFIREEDLPLPKKEMWYVRLTATPNRIFGEQVLVAAGMSDRWPAHSEEVPVLLLNGEGVLCNLGIDPDEKKKEASGKKKTKKVITLDTGATSKKGGSSRATATTSDKGTIRFRQSNLEDYVVASDSLEGLSHIGEKKKSSAGGSKSSRSAGSRIPEAGATPYSIALDEEEEEEHEEAVAKLVSRKRSREETAVGVGLAQKARERPLIGKQSRLRTVYKFPQKDTETVFATEHDTAQGPEVMRITGLNKPLKEKEKEAAQPKGPEVVKPTETAQHDAPVQTVQVTSIVGGSTATVPEQVAHKDASATTGGAGVGGSGGGGGAGTAAGAGGQWSMPQAPIGPKDTLGDIFYKTYTEAARGDTPHQPVWGLKQKDTFVEFAACRDWYLGSFPPREVNRQRARTHEGLYRAYIVGEANTRAAKHQIDFEHMKSAFAEEKAAFEAEKKSEEWGREGLKNKLHAAEELLSKERAEWKKVCEKDNQRMYAARSKITDLEAQIATLKGKVKEFEADKGRVEAELTTQVASKDKELAAKDVEIAELKRRLFEAPDMNESLEIDLEAERVKAETAEEAKKKAEEARDISTSALNVAQNNYVEAQTIVDTLVSESEWMRSGGIAKFSNYILNATEMDEAVAALSDRLANSLTLITT